MSTSRNPHFVQIGLDFGTAYSKCVCRDVMIDKAWVHIPSSPKDKELPFLIPSIVHLKNSRLFASLESESHYPKHGLYHLKQALEKTALGQMDDPSLIPYKSALESSDFKQLIALVEASATFFLAWIICDVRKQVNKKLKGFGEHPDDYIAINLAVPVADAQRPEVNKIYYKVLCQAWLLSKELNGKQSIDLMEIDNFRRKTGHLSIESCYIYPEVSANVQGFVRSRASREGMYLFSDTGAGTVDQSLFIFQRNDNGEQLAYLHGSVLPIGSSFIERYAADEITNGVYDWQCLEQLRREKEKGSVSPYLERARKKLHKDLDRGTTATIAMARKKLFNKGQIRDICVIFGGGGHCNIPYKSGALSPFSGCLFSPDVMPDIIGIPDPIDLELGIANKRWLPRLSVAYGLSFVKSELARFIYPVDIQDPSPQEIWQPFSRTIDAATKELC